MKEVQGIATVNWTVRLPEGRETQGMACDDPAVEAILSHISQSSSVYLWGEDQPPAEVFAEIQEGDVEVEADERIEEPEGGHVLEELDKLAAVKIPRTKIIEDNSVKELDSVKDLDELILDNRD